MTPLIRPFHGDDAPALAELTLAAILTIGAQAYSTHQILAWAARHPGAPRFVQSAAKGDIILVALSDEGMPAAYALLEREPEHAGHIDMLYCHPDHAQKGFAAALLAAIDVKAREAGIGRLFTEASELSRPAFARAGFALLHRRDFTIPLGAQEIAMHNYAMEKVLR